MEQAEVNRWFLDELKLGWVSLLLLQLLLKALPNAQQLLLGQHGYPWVSSKPLPPRVMGNPWVSSKPLPPLISGSCTKGLIVRKHLMKTR